MHALSCYIGLNNPALSRLWCFLKDTEFTTCNNVISGFVKTLWKKGRRLDKTEHCASITEDDFNTNKVTLDPNTPDGLVKKVWFNVQETS